jgi:ABC-type transport system involved in multi-copper enzyme maturation permease subunit
MRFLPGVWTIAAIELRQRVRGVAWYVLLGVCDAIILIVTALLVITILPGLEDGASGAGLYSTIVYFVLLVASLVAPALSGNAINGDRESGTLATTQVTLVTTLQLVLGKFLAAWISALAFLVAATPFLIVACAFGGVGADTVAVSLLVLAVELGVVSAVGVGLSGLIRRPLFSIVLSYLFVALLSVGTLIGFGLGGTVVQTPVHVQVAAHHIGSEEDRCDAQDYSTSVPRFDLVWWILAANPYVVLADAEPTHLDRSGNPRDIFGYVTLGVRSVQLTPDELRHPTRCDQLYRSQEPATVFAETTPSWLVGLLIHLGLGIAALAGAIATTRAPSRRLAAGSRIA